MKSVDYLLEPTQLLSIILSQNFALNHPRRWVNEIAQIQLCTGLITNMKAASTCWVFK